MIDYINNFHNNLISTNGVDHSTGFSQYSQHKRFDIIVNHIKENHFSILDFGCNTADLLEYLLCFKKIPQYTGIDVNPLYIQKCKEKYPTAKFAEKLESEMQQYVVASGVLCYKYENYQSVHLEILSKLWKITSQSLIFNALTKRNAKANTEHSLYNVEDFFPFIDQCQCSSFSILHDYLLNDFTIIMNK